MVVYQSHAKRFDHSIPSGESSSASPPPLYDDKASTPPGQSEDILPIKKQSKHGIE